MFRVAMVLVGVAAVTAQSIAASGSAVMMPTSVEKQVRVDPVAPIEKPSFSDELDLRRRPDMPAWDSKPQTSGYNGGIFRPGSATNGAVGQLTITGTSLSFGYVEFWSPVALSGLQPQTSKERAAQLIDRCRKVGPFELKPLLDSVLWKEIPEAIAKDFPDLVYGEFAGRRFVLVSNAPEHRMCLYEKDGSVATWHVTNAVKARDDAGGPAVSVTFDDEGARRLGEFTSTHLKQVIVATVNNRVVSAATLQSRLQRNCLLSSSTMTDEAADDLIASLNSMAGSLVRPGAPGR